MVEISKDMPTLEEILDENKAQSLLQKLGFSDWKAAWTVLRRMDSRDHKALAVIFQFLTTALSSAADPERSLINFERFMENSSEDIISELKKNPRDIEILVTIFSTSPFLTEILLHTPDAIELLSNRQALTERKTIDQFQSESVFSFMSTETENEKLVALRRYQRRQLLRIGSSDFLGLYDLKTVLSQLSRMAIGLVRSCLLLASQQSEIASGDLVVLALGKLGGWELNYSSDIDLSFVARRNPERYLHLVDRLIKNIADSTSEGFLYRVDLRLRPWGTNGPLISTMDNYLQYMQKHALLWEKQAFLKARPIAGNLSFGEELLKEIEPLLYNTPINEVRSRIFDMKQRTEDFLREKGRNWGEIKLGEGSIRDIEFVVQSLQLVHPSVRTRATLKAIPRLREAGFLSSTEARTLNDGYNFLRTIEHYLQITDYRQTNSLPSTPSDLALLARRLGFEGQGAGDLFIKRYEQHCRAIRTIFLKYVGQNNIDDVSDLTLPSGQISQHISRMDASYSVIFSSDEIKRHVRLINQITADTIVAVDANPLDDGRWRVTVVGFDYLGELSLICGLLFVYGLDIIESQVFTYEQFNAGELVNSAYIKQEEPDTNYSTISRKPEEKEAGFSWQSKRKIVDVFIVRPVHPEAPTLETWGRYSADLHNLLIKTQIGQGREASGELAKRVGEVFQGKPDIATTLYPIEIEIDNNSSADYTILEISSVDTFGFLYEFSNALALNHIYISRMFVQTIGNKVRDIIYVTDDNGQKITSLEQQRELRAATVLIKHFTHLLPISPNPEAALIHFQEFLGQLFDQPNWPDDLVKLEQHDVLDALARLLGVSDFLWDDFLRMQYSNLFPVVRDVNSLAISKDRPQLQNELDSAIKEACDWRVALNSFKDREMFRIDMRHILGYTPEFWDFSYELTDLAEVVVTTAYNRCWEELCKEYGEPYLENGSQCPASIFALGKCGGRELGFASDVELMLIYAGEGLTIGAKRIPASIFFEDLVRSIINSIQARQEGIFHVDVQLRPYGNAGSLAVSLEAFQRYYSTQGPAWAYERQALIKMRPLNGDHDFAEKVSKLRDEFLFTGEPFNVTAMRAMRERQVRHLVSAGTFNAKYSPGGLVDAEYLVQGLQITHGAKYPSVRSTNTRIAMAALAEIGILSKEDYTHLKKAHTFFCWLIESLRVVRGNTKDVNIPTFNTEEFAFLARRLRYGSDVSRLQEDLARYASDVQELNLRLLTAS